MDVSSLSQIHKTERFAVIIPTYNHDRKVADVVRETLKLDIPLFVVDDGSTDSTVDRLKGFNNIHILRHPLNKGKGAAVLTGFTEAVKVADWAITLDADGQHHPEDAKALIRAIPEFQRPIVVGMRKDMMKANAPWTSRFGRKFSNFWVWVSGGPHMSDSQSGFRLYPLPESMELNVKARRFQFEVEILVKARRKQIPIIETPVQVTYQEGSQKISHFRPFVDFFRNFGTFSRLITQRVFGLGNRD